MAFLVTARKWRPQKFDEVVGQEHITTTLKNAIKNNRIAHAYLFTGPRGVGKTTTARILAKVLNCENPENFEPCNKCENCLAIKNSQSMDIIEIDGASNRGIDEIRTLRESVKYAPTRGKYKIYIIDEIHMLTKESFNAFLKTLEEPPEHTIFIFATTDVHKVPLTIISRCQRFDFRRIQLETIKELLSKIAEAEKIKIDDKTLTTIAKKADGALRDAESYFDQIVSFCGNEIDFETVSKMLNLIDEEVYFMISDAILNKDFNSVFEVSETLFRNGWDFIDFVDGLTEHFRNILTVIITENIDLIESADIFKKRYFDYTDKFSKGDVLRALNYLNNLKQEIKFSQNQKLKLEIALTHLISLEKSSTIDEIISELGNPVSNNPVFYQEPTSPKLNLTKEVPPKKVKHLQASKTKTAEKKRVKTEQPVETISDLDKDFVQQKWQSFVDLVSAERALIVGPMLNQIKVVDLNGNKLSLTAESPEVINSLQADINYLETKSESVFGKRLKINFVDPPQTDHAGGDDKTHAKQSPANGEEDPITKLIKEELGGEEVR